MKQISTGAGLLGLGLCMVATVFVATQRGGGVAFAQGTGSERHIVYTNLMAVNNIVLAYRIWSDNAIDIRGLGQPTWESRTCRENPDPYSGSIGNLTGVVWQVPSNNPGGTCAGAPNPNSWRTMDNGTSGFRPLTDVDMNGETDGGDMAQVLMDFNTRSDDLPPPPIDCTINAPR